MSYKDNSFPIRKGKAELTSGVHEEGTYWNVSENVGTLKITWKDDTTTTITVPSGGAINTVLEDSKSVEILTGAYHRA